MNIDRSGPSISKYCHDGGVYYTYDFIEDGPGMGHVGLPWGADQLSRADNQSHGEKLTISRTYDWELTKT